MGKFGSIGGIGNIGAKVNSAVNTMTTKVSSMSPEQMTSMMEKATIGNAAAFVGGKMGINVNAGKIDAIADRYTSARSAIEGKIFDTIMGAVEAAGYKISLPDGDRIAQYLIQNNFQDKLESITSDIETNGIENFVSSIDIPKMAKDLGLSIEKTEKVTNKTQANTALGEIAGSVVSNLGDIGGVVGSGLSGIGSEAISAVSDIKDIATNATDNE